jgi:hypothetical protein
MNPISNFLRRYGIAAGLIFSLFASFSAATTVIPPEFDQLVNRSDYVVRAKVINSEPELRISGERRRIFTKVEIEVLEVIAGAPPQNIVLEFLGGRIGDEELKVGGMPRLQVGTESILFIKDNGRVLCPIYAMNHGHYPIEKEPETKRRYISRSDKVPLESVAEVAQELTKGDEMDAPQLRQKRSRAFTPDEFSREIRAIRNSNPRREK